MFKRLFRFITAARAYLHTDISCGLTTSTAGALRNIRLIAWWQLMVQCHIRRCLRII